MPETRTAAKFVSYQLTINNPIDHNLGHDAIKQILSEMKTPIYWCMSDEVAMTGTYHTHLYVRFKYQVSIKSIKNAFPSAHIEVARGTASENRDYIRKSGKHEHTDKAETRVPGTFEEWGELPEDGPGQGYRSDLAEISEMLDEGMNPAEIMRSNFTYRRFEKMIRSAFFDKRRRETPVKRDVKVHYIVGESGAGKSFTYVQLCEEHGEDSIYFVSDYESGGFDLYCGERILFMDEYKGQLKFGELLTLTDGYKTQVHARYANIVALWDEVYITSVFPPEELYKQMVAADARGIDKQKQLFRRITDITYCFVDDAEEYRRFTLPMTQYINYCDLKQRAEDSVIPDWVREAEKAPEIGDYELPL